MNFIGVPVCASFEVTAFPVPHQVAFTFLGYSANDTGSPPSMIKDVTLDGHCVQRKAAPYLSMCTVTVSNVSTAEAAGFYRVTVTNTQGSNDFRLQVKYKGMSSACYKIII